MIIELAGCRLDFRPWVPAAGKAFAGTFAMDTETTPIDPGRPDLVPTLVLAAACDGRRGVFLTPDRVGPFLRLHDDIPLILHHATFDLKVLHAHDPSLRLYDRVEADAVWDTALLHRLLRLAVEGRTASRRGEATLERYAEVYLGVALPKDRLDRDGDPIRLSYGKWLGRDPAAIEPAYLEYLARDAAATALVFPAILERIRAALAGARSAWGFVSDGWLVAQQRRWGPLTHGIQLRAAIVLDAITANGLAVDLGRREALVDGLDRLLAELRATLAARGYEPGRPGSGKALHSILGRIAAGHPHVELRRTTTGRLGESEEALRPLADIDPFVAALLEYRALAKLRSTFFDKMAAPRLHPSFDVLKTTGRTSSFGAINAQNLPRDDRVRSCFVAAPGRVLVVADYATVEMATLAQAMRAQFGTPSKMAEAINAGRDLHRMVAALALGKPEGQVNKGERQKAKPINFGKPGALGSTSLKAYALKGYGAALTDEEVRRLEDAWFRLFPEMRTFLGREADLGAQVADYFGVTAGAYAAATGRDWPLARRGRPADDEAKTRGMLGSMLLKVARDPQPATGQGQPYTAEERDYFWSRLEARAGELPSNLRSQVARRAPSRALHKAALAAAGRGPVLTLTGRLRAGATYAARHNTIFQGLAADGAKLALWKLWRAGHRVVNFVHDEVLVEVPADADLDRAVAEVEELMTAGMHEVVPDVRVEVEAHAAMAWSKGGKRERDASGRLIPWDPDVHGREAEGVAAVRLPGDGEAKAGIPGSITPTTTAAG